MLSLITLLFLLLKIINATKYSVTIMNDSDLWDKQGAVHTWLMFDSPNSATKYFSFESAQGVGNVIGGVDVPGMCTTKNNIEKRLPTHFRKIPITEKQYQDLIDSSSAFCASDAVYDLTPNNLKDDFDVKALDRSHREDFNCVTASHKILLAANIDILSNAKTPYDVKEIITRSENTAKRIIADVFTAIRRLPYAIVDASNHSHPW